METKSLLESISLSSVRLKSLSLQTGSEGSADRVEVARRYDLDIVSVSEHGFKIGLDLKIFCRPDGPFKLNMDIVGEYKSNTGHSFKKSDIVRCIDGLAGPLFARASLVAAFITSETVGAPIIFPPLGDPQEE